MSRPIDVSVVIPTRNRFPLLKKALASVLRQEDVAIEAIVVDDCSSDETAERLSTVEDERVRVLRHDSRQGDAGARNAGISAAKGEWIAFLDDDDLWAPWKLRVQLEAARRDGASFVYGDAVVIDAEDRTLELESPLPAPDELLPLLLKENVIPAAASNIVARNELVQVIGGFDARLPRLNDWDFGIRLAEQGRAAACADVLVAVRRHAGNRHFVEDLGELTAHFEYLRKKHAATAARYGVAPDRKDFTHWVASGHRFRGERFRASAAYMKGAVACKSPGLALLGLRLGLGEWATGTPPRLPKPVSGAEWLSAYR